MRKIYKTTLGLTAFLLIISVFTGISYSLYNNSNNEDLSLIESNENISINYLDGKDFRYTNIMPGDIIKKKISITNVSNELTYITLSLMDVELSSNDLKLVLSDNDDKIVYNEKITNIDTEVVKTIDLEAGKTISYTLMIENKSDKVVDNFNANILIYSESTKSNILNFKDTLLTNNKIMNLSQTGVGKDVATTNEGLIKTTDDLGEAYYFRGKVDNNFVNFGGFNFRILRINGDGTVRLILLDPLDNQSAYNSNVDEVEDYTEKLSLEKATITEKLNGWLNTDLADYSKYIAETSFCNDNTVSYEENNTSYLLSNNRIMVDDNPTLECQNNLIKSKVGLITADEVAFAGAYHDKINTDYFLYNGSVNNGWWTMTGSKIIDSNNSAMAFVVMPNGSLNADKKVSMEFAIRPVISIDKNTIVTGSGTVEDPYVIKK